MTQPEKEQFKNNLDLDSFLEYYKVHSDKEVCEHYDITKNLIKLILKQYHVKLTNEEKHFRFILNCPDTYGMPYEEYINQVNAKKISTSKSKYGDDYKKVFSDKAKQSFKEKYGVNNPSQVPEIRDRVVKTNLERYGQTSNLASQETKDKIKKTCLEKYGTEYASQSQKVKDKILQTNLRRYGVENSFQREDVKEKSQKTCQEKYGTDYASQSQEFKESRRQSNLKKYGVVNPSQLNEVKQKMINTNMERYGVPYTLYESSVKDKIQKTNLDRYGEPYAITYRHHNGLFHHSPKSKLEKRLSEFLTNNNIEFQEQFNICKDTYSHKFDFAIFVGSELKMLIDCDGIYYHGYISDQNGKTVNSYVDEYRNLLIPEEVIFLTCVETNEKECYDAILHLKDISYKEYVDYVFDWCRSIEFPFPKFEDSILFKSYKNLCNYNPSEFSMNSRPGMKVIEHFHPSIWMANKQNKPSPYLAWNNDTLLRKCIENRLIYKGTSLYPYKVLYGFSASQIAPKISVFNPYLSKYIVHKYLNQYDTIFDPCSGYSGRMLGVCSLGKKYIGRDINPVTVKESNNIIKFLNLDSTVECADLLKHSGEFDCIFTCTPYSLKEEWGQEIKNFSCDEWIREILNRYKCRTYVFVVDKTVDYKDFVVETLTNKSHYGTNSESVIVINK